MKVIAFTYLFLLFSCSMFAQENNGAQYDLNDPRNPNCPCHKYQQAADEEYQRELNKEKTFAQITKVGTSTVTVIDASTDIINRDKEIKEHTEIEEKNLQLQAKTN
jgi:kynurenine formamidase